MPKTSDVGVIVGRFQAHKLHAAQDFLIRSVYDTHPQTLIVLGLSQVRVSTRNPLDFEARRQMLLAVFPKATILYLKDQASDEVWSQQLDRLVGDYVSPSQTVCLYGGRDSFAGRYHGSLKVEIIEPDIYISGTELRKSISRSVKGTEDFRAGVIWAAANGHPKVFPTVDVAVMRGPSVLLVRKPDEKLWRFPGGFVHPNDVSYETAARREVLEETGAEVGGLLYCWSGRVDDWRYRDEADKIMTTLFSADFISGPVRPADDVAEAGWFDLVFGLSGNIVSEHQPLLAALLGGRS